MPSSRYLAVAGPNERARRSRAAASTRSASAIGGLTPRAPDGDRLDVLRAQHRAEPAAARVAAVVRDRRVPDEPLAGRADGGDAPRRAEMLAEPLLGLRGGEPPQPGSGQDARTVAVDDQHRRPVGGSAHDDGVVAGELARDREVGRRQCVVQQTGQRRFRDDRELGARRERRADERREHERERRLGSEGSTPAGASRCMSQVPSPAPPMVPRSTGSGQFEPLGLAGADVDHEAPAEIAARWATSVAITRSAGSPTCEWSRVRTRLTRGLLRRSAPRLSSRRAARRRAPSWKCGSSPSTSRAGWMPRMEEARSSSSAAAMRSSVRRSSRAGWSASTRARTVPGS